MPGSRSSPRLIEEILAFTPGSALFELAPLDQIYASLEFPDKLLRLSDSANPEPLQPISEPSEDELSAGNVPANDSDPASQTISGIFRNSLCHLEVTMTPPTPRVDHDWHIMLTKTTDTELHKVVYECSVSGAILEVKILPAELDQADFDVFARHNIERRQQVFDPDATPPAPHKAMELLDRIITNVLYKNETRGIRRFHPKAAVAFDTEFLARRLGFLHSEVGDQYDPPLITPELRAKYHRVRQELALFGLSISSEYGSGAWQTSPLPPDLYNYFDCRAAMPFGYARLSTRSYGALGATQEFNADLLFNRYRIQVQYDPKHVPHYLDALADISQDRQSEDLQMKVMELISVGTPTLASLREAYQSLGLSMDELPADTADEFLADIFIERVRQTPESYEELGKHLRLIADSRQSQSLTALSKYASLDLQQSYAVLGLDASASDQQISDNFYRISATSVVSGLEARTALKNIALSRTSPVLLDAYEAAFPEFMDLNEALSILTVTESMDDRSIITIFEMTMAESTPDKYLVLRRALRTIGTSRDSALIGSYLNTGEAQERASDMLAPVGLWNIGNTCYLNSLLQFYFTVSPLRERLEGFDFNTALKEINNEQALAQKKVGGRLVPFPEVKRSQKFVGALGKLFNEMTQTREPYVVPSEELAYMALIPPEEDADEYKEPEIAEIETSAEHPKHSQSKSSSEPQPQPEPQPEDSPESVIELLSSKASPLSQPAGLEISPAHEVVDLLDDDSSSQELEDMSGSKVNVKEVSSGEAVEDGQKDTWTGGAGSNKPVVPTSNYQDSDDDDAIGPIDLFSSQPPPVVDGKTKLYMALQRQQDVTECIENVLFQMEAAVKATSYEEDGEQNDFVKELFYGTTIQKLQKVADGSNKRVKMERFSSILVDVSEGPRDIYDALDDYFSQDVLQLAEGDTLRSVTAGRLPPIMQLQIQRVQFDRASGQPYKSLNPLLFEETIYLDRYLETDNPVMLRKRDEMREWRSQQRILVEKVAALRKRESNGLTAVDNLKLCASWLEDWIAQNEPEEETEKRVRATMSTILTTANRKEAEARSAIDELERLDKAISEQFSEFKEHGYRIHSLFIHRGQVSFGHYWIYIQDFKTGKFRKYNDEIIQEVPRSEVFDYSEGNTATPYYLVFIREDFVDKVDAIVRDPLPERLPTPNQAHAMEVERQSEPDLNGNAITELGETIPAKRESEYGRDTTSKDQAIALVSTAEYNSETAAPLKDLDLLTGSPPSLPARDTQNENQA